jgi:hypothetical protein
MASKNNGTKTMNLLPVKKKHHDAPMTNRDLYFCLRSSVVATGTQGQSSAVGRVTLVNWESQIVLDRFVKIPVVVANYRAEVTGINENHFSSREDISFDQARAEVGRLIKGKILIGHGLEVDLSAIGLSHPWCDVRDTATYAPYMERAALSHSSIMLPRDLRSLAHTLLGRDVVTCPVQEAIACIELYKVSRSDWEYELVKVVQQNDRQRQLVISMRSGSREGRMSHMLAAHSSIREHQRPACSINPINKQHAYTHWEVFHSSFKLEESKWGSVTPLSDPNSLSFDDDEVSSVGSSFPHEATNLQIKDLEVLSDAPMERFWSPTAVSDGTKRCDPEWLQVQSRQDHTIGRSLSYPKSVIPSDAWRLCSQSGADWSQPTSSSTPQYQQLESVVGTLFTEEEELLKHLPSQLLDDLDAGVVESDG